MKPKKKLKKIEDSIDFAVVGMQHHTTLPIRRELARSVPFPLELKRERRNVHDANAIAVKVAGGTKVNGMKIGFLRRQVAAVLAPQMDEGEVSVVGAEMKMLDPETSEAVAEIWLNQARKLGLDRIPT